MSFLFNDIITKNGRRSGTAYSKKILDRPEIRERGLRGCVESY
jgi:hypothetical protein